MNRIRRQRLLALPGVCVSVLPNLACPACWPAYAGLLTSVGLGFLLSAAYLLSLTAGFLALALGVMAFGATKRRGFGPFLLGLVAASGVLIGKFVRESNPTVYAAVVLLVVASLWNAWPRHDTQIDESSCPGCQKQGVQSTKFKEA